MKRKLILAGPSKFIPGDFEKELTQNGFKNFKVEMKGNDVLLNMQIPMEGIHFKSLSSVLDLMHMHYDINIMKSSSGNMLTVLIKLR